MPVQASGMRPARALPYELHTTAHVTSANTIELTFDNTGSAAAVFHVYDRRHLERIPRRYTVEANKQLKGEWDLQSDEGMYDLWVLGPNGYHRHFTGNAAQTDIEIAVRYDVKSEKIALYLSNSSAEAVDYTITANAYFDREPWVGTVAANSKSEHQWPLHSSSHWYDFTLTLKNVSGYSRRFAGHMETGKASISDPALGGTAISDQVKIV